MQFCQPKSWKISQNSLFTNQPDIKHPQTSRRVSTPMLADARAWSWALRRALTPPSRCGTWSTEAPDKGISSWLKAALLFIFTQALQHHLHFTTHYSAAQPCAVGPSRDDCQCENQSSANFLSPQAFVVAHVLQHPFGASAPQAREMSETWCEHGIKYKPWATCRAHTPSAHPALKSLS